jgi:diacylglycerol kinase (ATP)
MKAPSDLEIPAAFRAEWRPVARERRVAREGSASVNEAERLLRACVNSWDGIVHAVRTEAAVRTEVVLIAVALPVAFALADTPLRFVALMGALLVLLAVELLNTAIEKLADKVQPDHDPAIKYVKDLGSAAVTSAVLLAAGTWGAIAWEALHRR